MNEMRETGFLRSMSMHPATKLACQTQGATVVDGCWETALSSEKLFGMVHIAIAHRLHSRHSLQHLGSVLWITLVDVKLVSCVGNWM